MSMFQELFFEIRRVDTVGFAKSIMTRRCRRFDESISLSRD